MMQLGDFKISLINDGTFKLDGGTMFGMVPKILWGRLAEADKDNRIVLGKNCFLVETPQSKILIETGIGSVKMSDKAKSIYEMDDKYNLVFSLKKKGVNPQDIDIVILSHLHFDHAGGNTVADKHNKFIPTFSNARYIIQKGEWDAALKPNELTRRSYLIENLLPLKEKKLLELIDGDKEIVKGIKVKITGGHTRYHQIVSIESNGKKALFLGDLVPATFHLKTPYLTAYDAYPLELIEIKKKVVAQAIKDRSLLLWYHDPKISMGFLEEDKDGGIRIKSKDKG
jgi:glyoxylase-like metal-dependent hydrolase (beta-lactamase superfamily II)